MAEAEYKGRINTTLDRAAKPDWLIEIGYTQWREKSVRAATMNRHKYWQRDYVRYANHHDYMHSICDKHLERQIIQKQLMQHRNTNTKPTLHYAKEIQSERIVEILGNIAITLWRYQWPEVYL